MHNSIPTVSKLSSVRFILAWNGMWRAFYFKGVSHSKSRLNYPGYWPFCLANRYITQEAAVTSKSLYCVLGVDPKATQKEIKSAYYKLSMTYHPDKNRDSESASRKFREITAAYEILGNYLSRRKYDRGMITVSIGGVSHHETTAASPDAGKHSPFHKKPFESRTAGTATGHTPIYNYDEWMQMHYGDTFAKQQAYKRWQDAKFAKKHENHGQKNVEYLLVSIVGTIMLSFGLYWTMFASYDEDIIFNQQRRDK